MTDGQTRVLVLLLLLLGTEALLSPTTRGYLTDPRTLSNLPGHVPLLIAWGVGGGALFGLATVAPTVATDIVVLLLVLIFIAHGTDIGNLIGLANTALANMTKQQA